MASPRTNAVIGWSLAVLALLSSAVAAVEAYLQGYPTPLSIVTALLLVGTAIAWPLVTAERTAPTGLPTCRECGHTAWGFTEFRFCIHCGSTRVTSSLP